MSWVPASSPPEGLATCIQGVHTVRNHRPTLRCFFVVAALTALVSSACTDNTTTGTTGLVAQVQSTISPSTVTAQASTDPNFQHEADFTVNLSETAGTGATVSSISATVSEVAGGIAVNTGTVLDQVHVSSTSNRLDALGTLAIPFQVLYTLPGGGTQSQVNITLSIVDDNGASVGGNVAVNIQ